MVVIKGDTRSLDSSSYIYIYTGNYVGVFLPKTEESKGKETGE